MEPSSSLADELDAWLQGEGERTVDSLIEVFGRRSFAILFVLLLGVPALPLPTGGATHVFEVIAVLLALQLVAGRDEIWLPQRWRRAELAGPRQQAFITRLMRIIRRVERAAHPRAPRLFHARPVSVGFGLFVIAGSVAAFLAPPFTGLDTLPALAVVTMSLGMLFQDVRLVVAAVAIGVVGVGLEILLGRAAVKGIGSLL